MDVQLLEQQFHGYTLHVRGFARDTVRRNHNALQFFFRHSGVTDLGEVRPEMVRTWIFDGRTGRNWGTSRGGALGSHVHDWFIPSLVCVSQSCHSVTLRFLVRHGGCWRFASLSVVPIYLPSHSKGVLNELSSGCFGLSFRLEYWCGGLADCKAVKSRRPQIELKCGSTTNVWGFFFGRVVCRLRYSQFLPAC